MYWLYGGDEGYSDLAEVVEGYDSLAKVGRR
jgi:hypothetical protein